MGRILFLLSTGKTDRTNSCRSPRIVPFSLMQRISSRFRRAQARLPGTKRRRKRQPHSQFSSKLFTSLRSGTICSSLLRYSPRPLTAPTASGLTEAVLQSFETDSTQPLSALKLLVGFLIDAESNCPHEILSKILRKTLDVLYRRRDVDQLSDLLSLTGGQSLFLPDN